MKIYIKNGTIWNEDGPMSGTEADIIARKAGYYMWENFVKDLLQRGLENATFEIDETGMIVSKIRNR